jgi:hypothetical protein
VSDDKKVIGKPFLPGQSGNPGGRPAVPEDVKRIRKLTNDEIKEVGALLLESKQSELEAMLASDDTPALRKWIASVTVSGIKTGDEKRLNAILDRVAGKIPQHVDVSVGPRPVTIEKHDGTEVIMTSAIDVTEVEE